MFRIPLIYLHILCLYGMSSRMSAQISNELYNRCPEKKRPKNRWALTSADKRYFVSDIQYFNLKSDSIDVSPEIEKLARDLVQEARASTNRAERILNYFALGEYHQFYKSRVDHGGEQALYYYGKVIQLAGNDPRFAKEVAYAARGSAVYRVQKSNYEEAAKLLLSSLSAFKQLGDTVGMVATHSFNAALYSSLELYEKTIQEYNTVLSLSGYYKKDPASRDLLLQECYSDVALAYLGWYERQKLKPLVDSADVYINRCYHYNGEMKETFRSCCYFLFGYRNYLLGRYKIAMSFIDSSLASREVYEELIPAKKIYRGLCLLKLGRSKEAKKVLVNANSFQVEHSLKELVYNTLYQDALEHHNLSDAFRFRGLAYVYKDSAAIVSQRGKVFEVSQKYSVMEKEVEIKNLEIANGKKEQQRKTVVWIFAITCVSMLLVIIGLYTISRARKIKTLQTQALLEKEKRNKEDIIRLQERDLQRARKRVIFSLRKKISRDLHDELSSSLAGLRYYVNDLKLKENDHQTKDLLQNVEQEVESVYRQARDYMHNLNMGIDEAVGKLSPFLQGISKDLSERKGIDIRLKYDKAEIDEKLNPNQQNQLTLLLKEATTNILKHSGASIVEIMIVCINNRCEFSIADNGRGFEKQMLEKGLGLESMEIRIRRIKGTLQIHSSEKGTKIEGRFPL